MTIVNYKSEQTFKCDHCGTEEISGDMPPDKWYTLTGYQIDQRNQANDSGMKIILSDKGGHFCCRKCLSAHLRENVKKVRASEDKEPKIQSTSGG